MEIIKTFQYNTRQPSFKSELTFKSDCTEIKHIAKDRCYGQITTIQTYFPQDPSKEQKLIFPTRFIKFFKLLSSCCMTSKYWSFVSSSSSFVKRLFLSSSASIF